MKGSEPFQEYPSVTLRQWIASFDAGLISRKTCPCYITIQMFHDSERQSLSLTQIATATFYKKVVSPQSLSAGMERELAAKKSRYE
jgi:hypothetical protein